jgi:hypothetical protein
MKMKKGLLLLIIVLMMAVSIKAHAFESRRDYFLKPQIGLWFGPITPLFTTADLVDTSLGGGLFFRYNLPPKYLKIGLEGSYQYFDSEGVNELYFVPVYSNLIYTLPLNFPVKFQIKGGGGMGYIHIDPKDLSGWEPIFMTGLEMSFPAGRFVNIGMRADYFFIYEKYMKDATTNGHILNTGITVYFNLNL